MQFIYDNITAVLVAGVIILILGVIHLTSQSASADSGFYYMNRVQTLALIEMIDRDFPNIGAGVDPQEQDMLVDYSWPKLKKATRHVDFHAVVDSTAGAAVQLIRYQVLPVENPSCEAANEQCYEVQRLVHNGVEFEVSGRSNTFVTQFDVELRPMSSSLHSVREVEVRLAVLSPGNPQTVQHSHWRTRYRPFNLTLQNP